MEVKFRASTIAEGGLFFPTILKVMAGKEKEYRFQVGFNSEEAAYSLARMTLAHLVTPCANSGEEAKKQEGWYLVE